MDNFTNLKVEEIFNHYPKEIAPKMLFLRQLIFDTASATGCKNNIEETLKWGEPGYVTKNGSTIRIDWKKKNPEQYAIYFNCKTKLVDTFKELYQNDFKFEGNRAIVFGINEKLAINELKHCISMALNYHKLKHLPLLGG
jgi:hypothetical protein